jgi:hypothetical protein
MIDALRTPGKLDKLAPTIYSLLPADLWGPDAPELSYVSRLEVEFRFKRKEGLSLIPERGFHAGIYCSRLGASRSGL